MLILNPTSCIQAASGIQNTVASEATHYTARASLNLDHAQENLHEAGSLLSGTPDLSETTKFSLF